MSKLWIVHRSPPVRAALARATGLSTAEITTGAPNPAEFEPASPPSAILLGLEGDYERELEFAAAIRARVRDARWILICGAGEAEAVRRLFGALGDGGAAVVESPPSPVRLRAEIAAALRRRSAASLAERRNRARIVDRVAAWFADVRVPGLAEALDPRSRRLPLLLRGRPGSGRALLGRHAELSRGGSGGLLRVDARDLSDLGAIANRLRATRDRAGASIGTVWIDGIDALPASFQCALADWIELGIPPCESPAGDDGAPLRWIATAGPIGLEDRLEPALARAFVPLTVLVPPLDRAGDAIERMARHAAQAWAVETGEPPRVFAGSALAALAAEPWWGDRAELDAVLRATLAAARGPRIEAADLRHPDEPEFAASDAVGAPDAAPREGVETVSATSGLGDLSLDRHADASAELAALSERWAAEPGGAVDPSWRKLARSLSHEIRNPLVSIRTFTELLPEHYADETFRARFKELVGRDVARIQDVVARLAKAAERDVLVPTPVDVSALIERLLSARRDRIGRARLVVLSELERDAPRAMADADALETALAGLIDRALDSLPERGDLFIASHRIERAGDGRPRLRVLLRHRDPQAAGIGGELDPVSHILEYVLAEAIVSAIGGRLTIDPSLGPETLIVIDLPTP